MKKQELNVFNTVLPESIYFEPRSKSGREERQDAAQNRQRVLEAASRLFNERGVDAVTMSEIAVEAGVGKGTLYRRYPDKGALCLALTDQVTRDFQDKVLDYLRSEGQQLDSLEQLGWFVEQLTGYIEHNSAYLKPAREAGYAFNKVSYFSTAMYGWQYSLIRLFLRQAVEKGLARADLDLDYVTEALLAPLQVDLFLYQRQERGYSPARISAGLRQLLEGLRQK
ncbi:MAG TPA: TetR/AcrR family transcriptional regulator [Chloroflexia bacterium]|nr:TetR/AcrR family transcriptional regulator [Chloroflexia bacterium]